MEIRDLISRYQQERDRYISPTFNESQLRVDFIDPFFKILGWDITNEIGKPTNEREVLVEEGLRTDASENTKKPDYSFRLFSQRKFFAEAKKPFVKIESHPEPAKQIRRYGFTAKLKISVLTNFEYLAIYDCSQVVNDSDTSQKNRLKLYHFSEYETKIEEINSLIGKDSVYSGQFDEEWKEIEHQLQKFNVDDLFLKQINEWRILLGKEIFAKNPRIEESWLNDLVQSYINSIIFLRVCEDRNLEVYKSLLTLSEQKNFQALIDKFREADRKYNAALFSKPLSNEIISEDGTAFWTIIKQLYYPNSTYSFSVFSSDILGNVYEIFLGEQLKIEANNLFLCKKPENEDRDIVTTPTFIIKDILKETVEVFCESKTADDILSSKFADIACGSGAFLIETFHLLQNILIDRYLENESSNLVQIGKNAFRLKFEIKKQLLSCIYGVDKDFNAVEACKFGLLLKLMEDDNNDSISSPALPSLENNILFGNSLIVSNQTTAENREIINPFDFNKLKFDVIVGNPPYMATEHMKKFTPEELPIYKEKYESAFMQFDKYFLFLERGLNLLKTNGLLGYILPIKFLKVGAGKKLRKLLSEKKVLEKIISFGANQVFTDKTTYTGIFILKNQSINSLEFHEVQDLNDWKTKNYQISYENIDNASLDENSWTLVPNHLRTVYDSILDQSIKLELLIGNENIYNGIQTSANAIYVQMTSSEDENYLYFEYDNREWKVEKILTRPYFRTSNGEDNLNTYRFLQPNSFVIYPYLNDGEKIRFVDLNTLQKEFPETFNFLNSYKAQLLKRDIKPEPETDDEWYRYGRHQSLEKCDVPQKIVVGVLSVGDKYAIDNKRTFISSGGTAGYCMIKLLENSPYSIYYLQAILNSKYVEWFASLYGEIFRGGYIARGTKVLKRLPIRTINFDIEEEIILHDSISDKQENLIRLQTRIDTNSSNQRRLTPLLREFKQTKIELESELAELYNLNELDILIPKIKEIYAID